MADPFERNMLSISAVLDFSPESLKTPEDRCGVLKDEIGQRGAKELGV